MTRFEIRAGTGTCRVVAGASFADLDSFCPAGRTILVADRRVFDLHRQKFAGREVVVPGMGERLKSLSVAEKLIGALLRRGADRETTVVAVGGGALCDLVGLAASLYMRGLRFGLVPTTLLAQADAAVGGKNGVNVDGYKNLAGTVRQPAFVLACPEFLATLGPIEVRNGLAEIVKAGAVADAGLVRFLERNVAAARALDPSVAGRLVTASVRVKAGFVERDELEAGPRRLLNFGHTLGHALEREGGFSHGRAVSVGMAAAARLSARLGFLPAPESDRLARLLRGLGLPASARQASRRALRHLEGDKKRSGRNVRFVVLRGGLGRAATVDMPIDELREALRAVC